MDLDGARSQLRGTRFADLRWVADTGSTNSDLVVAARAGDESCALVADEQHAGRGRLDRTWVTPPGSSLILSVLIVGPPPPAGPHLWSVATALCARRALGELAGVEVGLKWPNDLVVGTGEDTRKLGGLLSEMVAPDRVVVGIGVNLAWPQGFPPELAGIATSLNLLGAEVDRWTLAASLLGELGPMIDELSYSAVAGELLMRSYRAACATLGQRVRVELADAVLVGTAVDVTDAGALVIEDDQRVRREVTAGDVVHLRPA